jgi:hypothetical protein
MIRKLKTDTGSLIDHASPDDVASLDERYSGSEAEAPDEENQEEFHKFDRIIGVGKGGLRGRGAVIDRGSSGGKEGRNKHTIRIFEGAAASELKSRLPYNSTDSILMATVQQAGL